MNEAFEGGGYSDAPLTYPVVGTRFEDEYAIFIMRPTCNQARDFVRQLFNEYRNQLDASEMEQAPEIIIAEDSATKYDAYCGLGATAASCPEADVAYPD